MALALAQLMTTYGNSRANAREPRTARIVVEMFSTVLERIVKSRRKGDSAAMKWPREPALPVNLRS